MFNRIFIEERIPNNWTKIQIIFFYKKGNRQEPKNFWEISLINTYQNLLLEHINENFTIKTDMLDEGK